MQRLPELPNLRWRCEAHANLPALMPLRTSVLNSGPFPQPALPGVGGTTGLSATPGGPACPSRASGWRSRASTAWGFPCCTHLPCVDMPLPLPRWDRWVRSLVGRPIPPVSLFANDGGLPRLTGGSAPTSYLSGPARHSLALRPVDSLRRQAAHVSRRLRRLRYLYRRSDSFRLERPSWPGGTCTRWEDAALSRRTINFLYLYLFMLSCSSLPRSAVRLLDAETSLVTIGSGPAAPAPLLGSVPAPSPGSSG